MVHRGRLPTPRRRRSLAAPMLQARPGNFVSAIEVEGFGKWEIFVEIDSGIIPCGSSGEDPVDAYELFGAECLHDFIDHEAGHVDAQPVCRTVLFCQRDCGLPVSMCAAVDDGAEHCALVCGVREGECPVECCVWLGVIPADDDVC